METQELLVTPIMAQKWLDEMPTNRGVSSAHVDNFVHAMKTGQFCLSPGGIAFDRSGNLRDGQHRLQAVVKLGEPQTFKVHTKCTEDELKVIDQGRPRTVADVLKMTDGDRFASNKTPVVRLFVSIERGRNVKLSEAVYRSTAAQLGEDQLDAICNIPRAKIAGPVMAALVYARPCFPAAMDLLRGKMINREGVLSTEEAARLFPEDPYIPHTPNRNVTLEAMLKCQADKLTLHHNPTDSMLKFMRGIEKFIAGEALSTLQPTKRGYKFIQDQRALIGVPRFVTPFRS